jgi:hypothetical protein
MELEFFSNHTFATVAGLGEGTVLRGKWDVIGSKRDQLWMQVWRFGFGRSVSGSVYRYVTICVCGDVDVESMERMGTLVFLTLTFVFVW